jgi:hypothetical protein
MVGVAVLWMVIAPAATASGVEDEAEWTGPAGNPLSFSSTSDIQTFLREARVISIEDVDSGVTKPWKILLERDGVRANAIFRYVDLYRKRWRSKDGLRKNFRDSYRYECAAFELAHLLGMENIPPAVLRVIKGKQGSLQFWVENSMTESERRAQGLEPPDPEKWKRNYQMMYLFDNLIYNDDRHYGNILVDPAWNFWLIDATRAFLTIDELKTPSIVRVCSRPVWERLQNVTDAAITESLAKFLKPPELEPVLARRHLLLEVIKEQINLRGEDQVLFDEE